MLRQLQPRNLNSRGTNHEQEMVANHSMESVQLVTNPAQNEPNEASRPIRAARNTRFLVEDSSSANAKPSCCKWYSRLGWIKKVNQFFQREKEMNYYKERMRKVMSDKEKSKADWELFAVVKLFNEAGMITLGYYQVADTLSGTHKNKLLLMIYWIIYFINLCLLVSAKKFNNPWLLNIMNNINLIRNIIPVLNLEQREYLKDLGEVIMFC